MLARLCCGQDGQGPPALQPGITVARGPAAAAPAVPAPVAPTPRATKWSKSAIGPAPTATRLRLNRIPPQFMTPTAQPTSPRPTPPRDASGSHHRGAGPGRHTPPPRPPGACPGSRAPWLVGRLRARFQMPHMRSTCNTGSDRSRTQAARRGPESSGSPPCFRRSAHWLVGLVNQ